MGMKSGKIEIC
jgi:hypothetical protein